MPRLILLSLLLATPAFADQHLALGDGEAFTFRVGFSIFTGAGEIKITSKAELDDKQPCLLVVTTTSTRGFVRNFYPFDARAESVYQLKNGHMVVHTERSNGKKPTDTTLTFDYAKRTADFRDVVHPDKNQIVSLPPGDPMDLISSLVQARAWKLKPGETIDALVMFEEEPYELTFHAEGYEKVKTSLGTFNTLVLVPKMDKTPPKGMFKRGSTVRVWISQDERHLPVKFEVEFKFGSGVATLVAYEPPTASAAALLRRRIPDSFDCGCRVLGRQRRRVEVEAPRLFCPDGSRVVHANPRCRFHQTSRHLHAPVLDPQTTLRVRADRVEPPVDTERARHPTRTTATLDAADQHRRRPVARAHDEVQHFVDPVTKINVPDPAFAIQHLRPPRAPRTRVTRQVALAVVGLDLGDHPRHAAGPHQVFAQQVARVRQRGAALPVTR